MMFLCLLINTFVIKQIIQSTDNNCYQNQPIHMRKSQLCDFCKPSSKFEPTIASALFQKYSTSSNFYFSRQVDDMVNNSCSQQVANYHEVLLEVNTFEFMRRSYQEEEFCLKIGHLSEYYKFNRDFPRCFDKNLSGVLMRYEDRLKKLDFRRVKNAIKREQGVSITSHHTSTSNEESREGASSNFGNVLAELKLENSTDSIALGNICKEIGAALGKTKASALFKGRFDENTRNFEDFLQRQRKKPSLFGKQYPRSHNRKSRQERLSTRNANEFFRLKPFMLDNKNSEKNSLAHHPSRQERSKKDRNERNDKVSSFHQMNINKFSDTLQNFYKMNNMGDKYQSIKPKNIPIMAKKSKSKQFRKSQSKTKTPSLTKLSRQQKNTIQSDRLFHRDDSKKVFRKNSTLKQTIQSKLIPNNQNRNALLANQLCRPKERQRTRNERQSKSISRSKSRAQLSKESPACQSSKRIIRTPSNLTQITLPKVKQGEGLRQATKMSNLINKKLSLYLKY